MTTNPYIFAFLLFVIVALCSVLLITFLRFLDNRYARKSKNNTSTKRPSVLIALGISMGFSFSLGCVFIAGMFFAENAKNISNFKEMFSGISVFMYPVGLTLCVFAALVATPLATRALRAGMRNLVLYGSFFWFILALYVFFAPSFNHDGFAFFGGILLSATGLIVIAQIPPKSVK